MLGEFAQIVDEITRGAEALEQSLRRARRELTETAQALKAEGPVGLGPRVIDLDADIPQNARYFTQALTPQAPRVKRPKPPKGRRARRRMAVTRPAEQKAAPAAGSPVGGAVEMAAVAALARGGTQAGATSAAAAAAGGGETAAAAGGSLLGTIAGVIGAVVGAGIAIGGLAVACKRAAEAALELKRAFADVHPAFASIMAAKDVLERRERFLQATMMVGPTVRELQSYQQLLEGTRHIRTLVSNLVTEVRVGFQNVIAAVAQPLDLIAKWIAKQLGYEERRPKTREEILEQFPTLRFFEEWASGRIAERYPERFRRQVPFNRRP